MNKFIYLLFVLCISSFSLSAVEIEYEIKIDKPFTHYADITMNISDIETSELIVKMAVWTPGSYLVREYSKNMGKVSATSKSGDALDCTKIRKNAWKINTENKKQVSLTYRLYAYELSVRTSYIDQEMAYLNPASVFLYIDGQEDTPSTISIDVPAAWPQISSALEKNGNTLKCPDYDTLVDSPILISDHQVHNFNANGLNHVLAIQGEGNYDVETLKTDLTQICETTAAVLDRDHPCKEYTFIVLNTDDSYGGLEHLHSTSLIFPRNNYAEKSSYDSFISLSCHEYFHLWNVKRIRPIELGPFDYENENYTRQLWVAEGITSYYDEYLLLRGGFIDIPGYLRKLSSAISQTENIVGNDHQSLAEASYDAWIKFYRRNENTNNCCVSYYTKGAVVSAMLNLEILHQTKGEKNLDHVMRALYDEYYIKEDRGFTESEFISTVNKIAGKDLQDFFDAYVYDVTQVDYDKLLAYVGLEITPMASAPQPVLGIGTKSVDGGVGVRSITEGGSAYEAGLNVNDEILAINEQRVMGNLPELLKAYSVGDKVNLTIGREARILQIPVTLKANPNRPYSIRKKSSASKKEKELYRVWLGESFDQ